MKRKVAGKQRFPNSISIENAGGFNGRANKTAALALGKTALGASSVGLASTP